MTLGRVRNAQEMEKLLQRACEKSADDWRSLVMVGATAVHLPMGILVNLVTAFEFLITQRLDMDEEILSEPEAVALMNLFESITQCQRVSIGCGAMSFEQKQLLQYIVTAASEVSQRQLSLQAETQLQLTS